MRYLLYVVLLPGPGLSLLNLSERVYRTEEVKGHPTFSVTQPGVADAHSSEEARSLFMHGVFVKAEFTYFCRRGLPYLGKQQQLCLL